MQIAEKGRGVAISPKSNGEQICNQLISDWEIFDPVTNGTSYNISLVRCGVNRIGAPDIHRRRPEE